MIPDNNTTTSSSIELHLLKGGKEYFNTLLNLIERAESTIHFQTYIFDEDETGTAVANALISAAQRNVSVFLLVDGYASGALTKEFIARLKQAGVHFKWFDPLLKSKYFYFGRRLHQKVVAVDDRFALVGGINVSNRYNDRPGEPAWLDWAVFAEGDVATELSRLCESRMEPFTFRKLVRRRRRSSSGKQSGITKVIVNDWVKGKREITRSYLDMFRRADHRIIMLSAYFLPNELFRKRLRAAVKRGVTVQVILAGTSDIQVAKYAERFMYRWLLKNCIEIYEYQNSVLHGKMAVCDEQWATVGSYNINTISAYASIELNLAITDPAFVKQAADQLNEVMLKSCVKITSQSVASYSWATRVGQQVAYYLYRVLFFLFTFYFKQRE